MCVRFVRYVRDEEMKRGGVIYVRTYVVGVKVPHYSTILPLYSTVGQLDARTEIAPNNDNKVWYLLELILMDFFFRSVERLVNNIIVELSSISFTCNSKNKDNNHGTPSSHLAKLQKRHIWCRHVWASRLWAHIIICEL